MELEKTRITMLAPVVRQKRRTRKGGRIRKKDSPESESWRIRRLMKKEIKRKESEAYYPVVIDRIIVKGA